MKEQQREIINGVMCELLDNMDCSTILLAKFVQDGLITNSETETIRNKSSNIDKCAGLLEILFKRQDAFLKLYEALLEQRQSGASNLIFKATKPKLPEDYKQMVQINDKHQFSTEKYFHRPPPKSHEFVESTEFNIFLIATANTELTTKKIRDTIPNIYVKTKKFSRKMPGMISLWTETNEIGKLLEKVSKSDNKHIIVTTHSYPVINKQVKSLCMTNSIFISTDIFSWRDLTYNFQRKLLSQKIRLLNEILTLEDLCEKYELEEDSLENINEQFLIQLIQSENDLDNDDNFPHIFQSIIPSKPKYYVTRTIHSRCMLSLQKIEDFVNDIFLFTGWKQAEMTSYFKRMTNTASSQILQKAVTVQFILLESEFQFDLICQLTARPVHWIHNVDKEQRQFMWIKSKGDITSIQKMIDPNICEPIPEIEFPDKVFNSKKYVTDFHCPVCLVDSPGMGKTELLANIGRSLESEFPYKLVVFARASDFTSKVKDNLSKVQMNGETLIDCICQIVCRNSLFTSEVFKSCMKMGLKINLLLDGYDEIPQANIEIADDILKNLCKSGANVRLFLSSRAQNLESLEKTLNVLAYKILPFSKEEQHQFLVSYWTHASSNSSFALDSNRLELFTSQCLNTVEQKIPKCDREFAGIPLQCLLIGIVFQTSAWEYSKSGNHFVEWSSNIRVHSVSDLFEKCIEVKFEDAVQKHQIKDFDHNECMYAHVCHAVKLIFPDFLFHLPVEAKLLFKFGILEQTTQTGGIQQFLHRTFAEYLVGWVAFAHLQSQKHKYIDSQHTNLLLELLFKTSEKETRSIFCVDVAFEFENWMCLYFINQKCGELHSCAASTIEIKGIAFNHCIKHMALACARHDFEHILDLFFKTQNVHLRQLQFVENLLFDSVYHAELPLIQFVCNYFEDLMYTSKIKYELRHVTDGHEFGYIYKSLLHVAVEQGKYDVVEYLCKEKGFEKSVKNTCLLGLYYVLSFKTRAQRGKVIQQKLKILEYLSNLNSYVLTDGLKYYELTFDYIHSSIVRHFCNLLKRYMIVAEPVLLVRVLLPDEDIYIKAFKEFPIHVSSKPNTNEKQLECLKNLLRILLLDNVKLPQKLQETASTFTDLGILFENIDDSKYQTILKSTKVSEATNVEYLNQLQSHGLNFNMVNAKRQNLLHMLPAKASIAFVQFLIQVGVSVNLRDKDENIPLHKILTQKQINKSILEFIIEQMLLDGGNEHVSWENLLETAIKSGNSCATKILLEKVSSKIISLNVPMHFVTIDWKHDTANQTEIVENLLKFGGDIRYLTENIDLQQKINSGECTITFPILERLASYGFECSSIAATKTLALGMEDKANYDIKYKSRLWRCLLQLGADINVVDDEGNSLLHKATITGQLEYVRKLLDNGLSPNRRNNLNQTPLHLEPADESKELSILEMLVSAGGDLCAKDKFSQYAIFKQTRGRHGLSKPFVKILLTAISRLDVNSMLDEHQSSIVRNIILNAIENGLVIPEDFASFANNTQFLHKCVRAPYADKCVKVALSVRLSLNINNPDSDGNTPLHCAFSQRKVNFDVIKSLVKAGADLNIKNKLGQIPVECFQFPFKACIGIFKFLGIYFENVPNVIAKNCLYEIKENKITSALHFLSSVATEGINILDFVEPNFIFEFAKQNALSLIRFVHSLGYDLKTRDAAGNTILHYGLLRSFANSPQNFHYLLDYAVTTGNGELISMQNHENRTPLMCAVEKFDVLECSLDLLKEFGTEFNFEDDSKMPLIVAAVKHGRSVSFIKLLQKYGCLLNPLTHRKWIHLLVHEMVKKGSVTYLQMLLDMGMGFDVNMTDTNGNTLLHLAILENTKNVSAAVEFLLENFADKNAINNDGLSPFELIAVLTAQHFANEPDSPVCIENLKGNPSFPSSDICRRDISGETVQLAKRQKLEPSIFEGFQCDCCGTRPIKNLRYKCLLCENYDLCHDCVDRSLHSNHIFIVVESKQQSYFVKHFHNLNFWRIAAGWKYYTEELPKHMSKCPVWEMTCSCCERKESAQKFYMCLGCSFNQCDNCWQSCQNTHLMAVVFSSQQCVKFSKLFRRTRKL